MKTLTPFNNMPKRDDVVAQITKGHPEWTKRKIENAVNRRMEELRLIAEAMPANYIKIKIEWKRSATWGANPSWEAWVWGEDTKGKAPEYGSDWHKYAKGGPIGGCGYDKCSTATAAALNALLTPWLFRLNPKMLLRTRNDRGTVTSGVPYGFWTGRSDLQEKPWTNWTPSFDGGVGVDCHENIVRYLGGEVVTSESGGTWDLYVFKLPPFKEPKT